MSHKSARKLEQAKEVFLAHGWDDKAVKKIKALLGKLGLRVADWEELASRLRLPLPFNFDIVREGLVEGNVYVVLLTPDDISVSADHVCNTPRRIAEKGVRQVQARPNVLIETGMALAIGKDSTVIVVVEPHRVVSDLEGMNVVRTQDKGWAYKFARRLQSAFENVGKVLPLSPELLKSLESNRPFDRQVKGPRIASKKPRAKKQSPAHGLPPQIGKPQTPAFAPDPVNRRVRLLDVYHRYAGPTSARWRFDPDAEDNKVMRESEAEDKKNPMLKGTKVYVQQHYESEYNGKIGTVVLHSPDKHFYSVVFPPETGLARKSFHVMYLSRCK